MEIFRLYESMMSSRGVEHCVKMFGEELFGQQFGGEEPNTAIEDKVYQDLKKYTMNDYGAAIAVKNPSFIVKVKTLQSCINKYPEILHPEGIVYRGFNINIKTAFGLYIKSHGKPTFKLSYKPRTYVESWSENRNETENFAMKLGKSTVEYTVEQVVKLINVGNPPETTVAQIEHMLRNYYDTEPMIGVIVSHVATPESFLFKSKYFDMISYMNHKENEVLRISHNPIVCDWEIIPPEFFTVIFAYLFKHKQYLNAFKQ